MYVYSIKIKRVTKLCNYFVRYTIISAKFLEYINIVIKMDL